MSALTAKADIARRFGSPLGAPSRHLRAEASAVILRGNVDEAVKAAAKCFLRTKAATLRDTFCWQACLRKQTPRRFHSQALNGTGGRLPLGLRVVPAASPQKRTSWQMSTMSA
jgi:hypothetical protein